MYEKVNPAHPDKIADRIAGAIVDWTYKKNSGDYPDPRVAVEVLIGHGKCTIINETSCMLDYSLIKSIVRRIAGKVEVEYREVRQDEALELNQVGKIRCGDNGIFKGMPVTPEQRELSQIARWLYREFPHDGKYIIEKKEDADYLIICQSNAGNRAIELVLSDYMQFQVGEDRPFMAINSNINPLGYWTGGTDVDSGATNRKLGSDMGDAVTGGGLHGKDLSKADVAVNIYAHLKAQRTGEPVELKCAIGDEEVDGKPYADIVQIAKHYIEECGGFEKFAEWGLI